MEKETKQQKMWRAMRVMKVFSIPELQVATATMPSVSEQLNPRSIVKYCTFLYRGGYLVKLQNNYFKLVKSTGPSASMILNEHTSPTLEDPNTKEKISVGRSTANNKEIVLDLIKTLNSFTVEELTAKTNLNLHSIKTVIKRLVKEGVIYKVRTKNKGVTRIGVYILSQNKMPTTPPIITNSSK